MADSYDIIAQQGVTYSGRFIAKDSSGTAVNLSGYIASGGAKFAYSDTGLAVNFNPFVSSATSGFVDILIPASGLSLVPVFQGFYDIDAVSGSIVLRVAQGKFNLEPSVIK